MNSKSCISYPVVPFRVTLIHHHHHQGHGVIFRPIDFLNVLCVADARSVCDS